MPYFNPGKALILAGIVLVAAGTLLTLMGRFPFLGHLPGDLKLNLGKNTTFYFPFTTSIVLSVLLSLIVSFLRR